MPDVTIRDARPGDQAAIQALTLSAYQEYAPIMGPRFWEGYRQNILATLADVKPAEQIVAEQAGALVGTVLLVPPDTAEASIPLSGPEIRLLAVAPSARGRGIGAALVQECIRRVRDAGGQALTLHTSDIMRVAMQLYERMGFLRAPELDFHPVPEVTIKGFRLNLREASAE